MLLFTQQYGDMFTPIMHVHSFFILHTY